MNTFLKVLGGTLSFLLIGILSTCALAALGNLLADGLRHAGYLEIAPWVRFLALPLGLLAGWSSGKATWRSEAERQAKARERNPALG